MKRQTRIGVFHPSLNFCGGAEWVAVNVINAMKKANYETIILTNEQVDQAKLFRLFGKKVNFDFQIIFPFEIAPTYIINIYNNFVRALILKSKCDIVIDTFSSAMLPGVDVSYIHFPFLANILHAKSAVDYWRNLKSTFYFPYLAYEKSWLKRKSPIFLANSKYTMKAIKEFTGAESTLLYPPISKTFFVEDYFQERTNTVVSVGRICSKKRFDLIPLIAKLTNKNINFLIIGLPESQTELDQILKLIRINNVESRVKVLTDVSNDRLRMILRTSKVFLHTAFEEHFGVSIAEALASGCVTIVHDSGGPKEFVPNELRFSTVSEAAKKIEKAIIDWNPSMVSEFTLYAKQFSEETFSEKLTLIVQSLLRRKIK